VNSCEGLRQAFGCAGGCEEGRGYDQPSLEVATGVCRFTAASMLACDGSAAGTRRLCPCRARHALWDAENPPPGGG
jgi:hypothetical protein